VIDVKIKYTDKDVFDIMIGLFAYDSGHEVSDIGDDDNSFRVVVAAWLDREFKKPENKHRHIPQVMDRFVREEFLAEEALARGYGCEDVVRFLSWLEEADFNEDSDIDEGGQWV